MVDLKNEMSEMRRMLKKEPVRIIRLTNSRNPGRLISSKRFRRNYRCRSSRMPILKITVVYQVKNYILSITTRGLT